MNRYSDWQTRLDVFLRENGNRKFKYGEWDCCLFVCSAIEAMTGVDPAEDLRGEYSSAKTARSEVARYLEWPRERGDFLSALVIEITSIYHMEPIEASHSRRGDAVLIERAKGHSLGIVSLSGIGVVVVAGDRLVEVPFSRIRSARAWRVG